MIRFRIAIQPDSSIQNRIRIGLDVEKTSTGSDMDIQTALITAVECSIRVFFGYKPDWIKYLDSATGLGSDWITQWKYWTGLGSQKSSIRSTLESVPAVRLFVGSALTISFGLACRRYTFDRSAFNVLFQKVSALGWGCMFKFQFRVYF